MQEERTPTKMTLAEMRDVEPDLWSEVQMLIDVLIMLSLPLKIDNLAGEGLRETVEHLIDAGYLRFCYSDVAGVDTQKAIWLQAWNEDHYENAGINPLDGLLGA